MSNGHYITDRYDEAFRVVIGGADRVGFAAAQRLNDRDQTLVIVDKDPEVAERLVEDELGTVVCGNITSPEVLGALAPPHSSIYTKLE